MSRAFPLYSRKTPGASAQTVRVGFIVVGDHTSPVTEDDVKCLMAECEGQCVCVCVCVCACVRVRVCVCKS